MAECVIVNLRGYLVIIAAAAAVVLLLFDVDPVLDFAGSESHQVPDPAVEAAYQACFAERDEAIHAQAFGTIDNPDVQKEFITANRARAERECRALHPERLVTVQEPAHFNLVDVRPRYW